MEQVFRGLQSTQKNHQKDELLEDPAARSHQFPGGSCFMLLGSPENIFSDTRIAGLSGDFRHPTNRITRL